MLQYRRTLAFSPFLTVQIADGCFYPPYPDTKLSEYVLAAHSPLPAGEQQMLYSTLVQVVNDIGRDDDGDVSEEKLFYELGRVHDRTAIMRLHGLELLLENPQLPEELPELNEDFLRDLNPAGAAYLSSAVHELRWTSDETANHFAGMALFYIDDALALLGRNPIAAVDFALLAKEAVIASRHFAGKRATGALTPAKSGGTSKAKRSQSVAKYALELAEKGNYVSRAEAVRKIKEQVLSFAREKYNWQLSPARVEKTIGDWLAAFGYNPRAR